MQPGERDIPVPAKARPGLHRGGWVGKVGLRGNTCVHVHMFISLMYHPVPGTSGLCASIVGTEQPNGN
jgi:hypothetical protein